MSMDTRTDDPWQYKAECLGEDPELFFPIGETGHHALQIDEAKIVCRRCDVRDRCLEEALRFGAEGVWGATSKRERDAIVRRNQRLAREALAKLAG